MFTGIVEEKGRVSSLEPLAGGWRLRVEAGRVAADADPGDSIAVNGCCLTVVETGGGRLGFDLLDETRRVTSLERAAAGAEVNLESSVRAGGKLGGHFVTGHIDGTGTVAALEAAGADRILHVKGPAGCARFLVSRGSIAVDGVSLTVAGTTGDTFTVHLIPHTLAVTTLGNLRSGDRVNLEFDILGKYVEKQLAGRSP